MASFRPIKKYGEWYVRCRAPNKKEVRFKVPSAKNKNKAERLAEQMHTRYSLGLDDPWERKNSRQSQATLTLNELIHLYLKQNHKKWKNGKQGYTYRNKEYRLSLLEEFISPARLVSQITYKQINKGVNSLPVRQTSKKSYLKDFKALFNWSNSEGITQVNTDKCKLDRQPAQKLTGYIEFEDLRKIINRYLTRLNGKQIYADVWHFVFFNGARRSEIPSIQKRHVDLSNKYIRIGSEAFLTKHNMENRIPIAPENIDIITKYYKATQEPLDALFPVNATDASAKFTGAAKKSFPGRRKRWGIHLLRHSCAMHLMNHRGWHEEEVQEFLRHTSSETTKKYRHAAPTKLRNKFYGN